MNNKAKYEALYEKIKTVHGMDFVDMCVDVQNCGVKDDNSEEFWGAMLVAFHNSVGERLSDAGIDPAHVGVRY